MTTDANNREIAPAAHQFPMNSSAGIQQTLRALLITLFTGLPALDVAAADNAESLQIVRDEIDLLNREISHDREQADEVRHEILELEKQLHGARSAAQELGQAITDKELEVSRLNDKKSALESAFDNAARHVANTLVARYKLWREPRLKVLMSGDDLAEVRRHLRNYEFVTAAHNVALDEHAARRAAHRAVTDAAAMEIENLETLRAEAHASTRHIETTIENRSALVRALSQLLTDKGLRLEQLTKDEEQLSTLIETIKEDAPVISARTEASLATHKGQLAWPTAGAIAKAPGSALRSGGARWSGVVIESPVGSEVTAVADGEIAYADWFRNLGLLVIVDHGNGYMSLYGYNQELYKQPGDSVQRGEVLAAVGNTGGQAGGGLYFEIRENGVPQDPRQWCRQ